MTRKIGAHTPIYSHYSVKINNKRSTHFLIVETQSAIHSWIYTTLMEWTSRPVKHFHQHNLILKIEIAPLISSV